jgi:hypothetical protein
MQTGVVSILTKDGYVWYSEHSSQVPNAYYKSGRLCYECGGVDIDILCLFLTQRIVGDIYEHWYEILTTHHHTWK